MPNNGYLAECRNALKDTRDPAVHATQWALIRAVVAVAYAILFLAVTIREGGRNANP